MTERPVKSEPNVVTTQDSTSTQLAGVIDWKP